MLTVTQVSRMLNIKASTIYSWVGLGKIPHVKIHGLIRFDPQDLRKWIDSFKNNQPMRLPNWHRKEVSLEDLECLIAEAKREAYNSPPRGNHTDKIEPHKKGGADGAL